MQTIRRRRSLMCRSASTPLECGRSSTAWARWRCLRTVTGVGRLSPPVPRGVALILINRTLCDVLTARGVGTRTATPSVSVADRRAVLRGYWDAHGNPSRSGAVRNVNIIAGNEPVLIELAGWLESLGLQTLGVWRLTGHTERRVPALAVVEDLKVLEDRVGPGARRRCAHPCPRALCKWLPA